MKGAAARHVGGLKNDNKSLSPIKERQGPPVMITPGPGHYSQPDLNRWFKRSYNMNFSEV